MLLALDDGTAYATLDAVPKSLEVHLYIQEMIDSSFVV